MERYQLSKERKAVLESLPQAYAVYQYVDKRVVTLVLSEGFCKLFGYRDRSQAYDDMDHDMYRELHPDDTVRVANAAVRFATEGGTYEVIYRTKTMEGAGYRVIHAFGEHEITETGAQIAHIWYTDEGAYSEGPNAVGSVINRVLNNALHEQSIVQASHYDFLTGLPSMTYFFEVADTRRDAIVEQGKHPVLMYMDFSGMKFYNARHGFAEGDKMLQVFARVLVRAFGNENCCHIGADHFAAIGVEEGLEDTLNRLFQECQEAGGGKFPPVHVGIYPNRVETVHISSACDRAKMACSALKGSYSSGFHYYSSELREDALKKQYIIENLDTAIAEKWIQVYYQPIIRAVNQKVCDEEALARWIDPANGLLSPAEFIPYLEDAGLLYKLDLYVLDEVLEKMRRQKEMGMDVVPHSVNLSRSDFDACDIVEEIRKRVDMSGISRDRITIEVTESVIGSDFDFMKEQVQRFQALGFPVWMDDFGSGYSSLDVLQSIKFNLLKFDMSFMKKLNEGDNGKIILTELMKMATALGVDTVCEGVETVEQVRFLQEIGCSKLQGYYFCKPVPFATILEHTRDGFRIGYENADEATYYESIGCLNLYDLSMVANKEENLFQNFFNTLPMGIIEIKDDTTRFVRCNPSYRDFIKRFFGMDMTYDGEMFQTFHKYDDAFLYNIVKTCCEQGVRSFYDEKMPDGSVVHSFARRISVNPVTGCTAVAIAVLSISDPDEGASYADIARALAADYYNIYVVDLDTERFIEYSSRIGGDELAMERHGEDFFAASQQATMTRIYEEDRELFLTWFTKENIVRELDAQGVFTATYRLIDTGAPMYVNMKVTRMQPGGSRIIMGISNIDSQMKQKEQLEKAQQERDMLTRIMALSDGYLSLYTVSPDTGHYLEYSATTEYETLGFAKEGMDFFEQGIIDGKRTVHPEDLPQYLQKFTRENVLKSVRETGVFRLHYRLVIQGKPRRVTLKIAAFKEGTEEKLFAGVRAWVDRR